MAPKLTRRLMMTGTLLGGVGVAVVMIGPAGGTSDASDRPMRAERLLAAGDVTAPLELLPAEIAKIQPTNLVERLKVSGEVRPVNQAILRARSGGMVIQTNVREGQSVRAGDVLVRFESEDLYAAFKQREADRVGVRAEMVLAMQSLNRIEQLTAKSVASQEQLDKAESSVAALKARLDSLAAQVDVARTALREADVIAPFDGVVSTLSVHRGSRVAADTELLTIVDVSLMEARVLVSTRDVSRVAAGQAVELQIDGFKEQLFHGDVARISPVADDGSRFVPAYVHVSNDGGRLRGGMFVTGVILVPRDQDAIVVPVASLRNDGMGDYVLKVVDRVLVRQPVTVLSKTDDDGMVHISGLIRGDTIVTAPLSGFQPDLAVTMTKAG